LIDGIYNSDWFMVAADFDAYTDIQRQIDAVWEDSPSWNRKAVLNVARMGWFSSDRTIRQYAKEIWGVPL
jgi:starch phosphorylase